MTARVEGKASPPGKGSQSEKMADFCGVDRVDKGSRVLKPFFQERLAKLVS
jgi:hypothetical protein